MFNLPWEKGKFNYTGVKLKKIIKVTLETFQ